MLKINGVKPLSVNEAWQGRRFKTKKYLQFERDLLRLLPDREIVRGWVLVRYYFRLPSRQFNVCDVGNFEKCLTDIIVKKGYIEDDRKILELCSFKYLGDDYQIGIIIESYPQV